MNSDIKEDLGGKLNFNQPNCFVEAAECLTVREKGKFKWNESFEALKLLMKELTRSDEKWSTPGGYYCIVILLCPILCPFPSRRGWCVEGNRCDFLHMKPSVNEHKLRVPCPFLRRKDFCLQGNRCDFFRENFLHNPMAQWPRMFNSWYLTPFLPYQTRNHRPQNYFQQAWFPHSWPSLLTEVSPHQPQPLLLRHHV